MTRKIANLLSQPTPDAQAVPAHIERLSVAAYDLQTNIVALSDNASAREESAMIEAADESNDAKRKARRAEILRGDSKYATIKRRVRDAERLRVCLIERAARLRREFRLFVAERMATAF